MKRILLALGLCTAVFAQDELNRNLSSLGKSAALQYMGPMATGWAAGLSSGWNMRGAMRDSLTFQWGLSGVLMRASSADAQQTFSVQSDFRLNQAQAGVLVKSSGALDQITDPVQKEMILQAVQRQLSAKAQKIQISGPTIMGSTDSTVQLRWKGGRVALDSTLAKYYGKDSVDLQDAHMNLDGVKGYLGDYGAWVMAPQLRLGTIQGSSVVLRVLPQMEIEKFGFISYYGIQVEHNISRYFPKLPVDLVVAVNAQRLRADEYFKLYSYQGGLWCSKTWGGRLANVQPYMGVSVESSEMQVAFDVPLIDSLGNESKQKQHVSMDLSGENLFRGTLGLTARLLVVDLNVEYALAKRSVLAVQAGLAF